MAEPTENTFTSYLGPEFQLRLMWQLLVEPEFAEKTIPNLSVDYFDDPNYRKLFIIILEYYKEFGKVPNLQNQSIQQAINQYKTPNNQIEEESLFSVIDKIKLWNERILNKELDYDGEAIRKTATTFIKQQEWRKFAEFIIEKTKNGEIRKKHTLGEIDEKLLKISHIGEEEDFGTEVIDNIEKVLRKEFRQTIPTGIRVIDIVTDGGLGKGEIGLILTPSGVGKAQPLSSKILTPNGWVMMGDIKVDNLVIGSNGKSQKVIGVFPQGERDIYKIDFTDNTSVLCDKEHIWSVNTHKQRTDKHKVGGVTYYSPDNSLVQLTVGEMMDDFILKNRSKVIYNYRLPNIQPVEFIEKELTIHPYVMGILLGDGCLSKNNQPHIVTTDKFVVDKICEYYPKIKIVEFQGRKENYLKIFKVLLLDSKLHLQNDLNLYGKLSYEKEIPNVYLFNSLKNRQALLQGLIDSDGTVSSNGTIIYSTTSPKLAGQVRELVLSLGGTCNIRNKKKQYNKNSEKVYGRESYSITISFPESANIQPCLLPRKLERIKYRTKYANQKFISNISYSHKEDAQCIYVENDDHLYVTDDYVLTHNTTMLTKIANEAYSFAGKNVAQIVFEDTIEQIQRKHFAIWTDVPLSKMDERHVEVAEMVEKKKQELKGKGHLVIKKFSQENTTMMDIRNWMIRYEKKWGFKFDMIILDYLDCLESHKKTTDRTEAELQVIKSFEALAADFNIPGWTAIQTNRSGFDSEYVEAYQTGGSIKRIQKAHFFMSVAKTADQKEAGLANIRIIKARFAQDGQTFKDCTFNNDTMKIIIEDERYPLRTKDLKKHDSDDIDSVEKQRRSIEAKSSDLPLHKAINDRENELISKVDKDTINNDTIGKYKKVWDKEYGDNEKTDTEPILTENTISESFELDTNTGITKTEFINDVPEVKIDDILEIEEEKTEPIEEKKVELIDPDEQESDNNQVLSILEQIRKNTKGQDVMKKD